MSQKHCQFCKNNANIFGRRIFFCKLKLCYVYLNWIICVSALFARVLGSKDLSLSYKTSKADGEQDMKEIKMKSLEILVYVRENWVSSLVRHRLAEPAPLIHLQVSPRQSF